MACISTLNSVVKRERGYFKTLHKQRSAPVFVFVATNLLGADGISFFPAAAQE